ncbi:MAG: hypothetical protein AAB372_00280 [Patescibacteria group bacterium]
MTLIFLMVIGVLGICVGIVRVLWESRLVFGYRETPQAALSALSADILQSRRTIVIVCSSYGCYHVLYQVDRLKRAFEQAVARGVSIEIITSEQSVRSLRELLPNRGVSLYGADVDRLPFVGWAIDRRILEIHSNISHGGIAPTGSYRRTERALGGIADHLYERALDATRGRFVDVSA